MNLKITNRRSKLGHKFIVIAPAILICVLIASPFVFVIDAEAYSFSASLDKIAGQVGLSDGGGAPDLAVIVGGLIYGALGLLGVVSLMIIIIAGYRWMMSGGNEETINNAKAQIKNAVIGVIITLGAYSITYFVINQLID